MKNGNVYHCCNVLSLTASVDFCPFHEENNALGGGTGKGKWIGRKGKDRKEKGRGEGGRERGEGQFFNTLSKLLTLSLLLHTTTIYVRNTQK